MKTGVSEKLEFCRVCGKSEIEIVLDLGAQPPANSLRQDKAERLEFVPLVLCRCQFCGALQLTQTIAPEYLFSHYVWVTGTSKGANSYSHEFCESLAARSRRGSSFVVEVASNDGTFLKPFQQRGNRVLGIDPAKNIAAMACVAGIPTLPNFFGLEVARHVVAEHGRADIIFARNVLPHVANAQDVVAGLAHCLSPDGVGAVEFHRADIILEELHYDSIYHEHLFYHSLHSIRQLLEQFGLKVFDVTESPISGGSFVAYFGHHPPTPTESVKQILNREQALGILDSKVCREFAFRCAEHRSALRALVLEIKGSGKRIIGYGASARSSTLLNYCEIDHRHLDLIADQSELKHGRYTPGTDIAIVSPKEAFDCLPDAVLLLAWNFRDEILAEITQRYRWHGEVIVPLPGLPVVIQI